MKRILGGVAALLMAAGGAAGNPTDTFAAPDDAYLDALRGRWIMQGTLAGKPVRYDADGQRVLQGGFLRLHMLDVNSPPRYEAELFVGFDHQGHDYIAHWLDRFGAAGARVVARGVRRDEQLVLMFPYAEGAFRDTFTWLPASQSWTLLLESQQASGTWSTFASYTLTRQDTP
jgi:hypothetical protein